MGLLRSIRFATWRLLEYTGLVIFVAVALTVVPTFGRAVLVSTGADLQEKLFPAMASMRVFVDDPKNGSSWAVLPAFRITAQAWVGNDLLLSEGTLCKAQDYAFVDAKIAFGDPEGVFQPAQIEFLSKAGPRVPGCQTWRNWLLVGAKMSKEQKWFLVLTHRPKHGLWDVRQRLGPFDFPSRSSMTTG